MYATEKAQANAFSGIFFINQDGSTRFQVGFPIPIVFKLKDSNGNPITNAAVTFTAQQINPTTGAPIGNAIVDSKTPFKYTTLLGINSYVYLWNTKGLSPGVYVMKLTIDYGKSTQNVLVSPGLNGISGKLTLIR